MFGSILTAISLLGTGCGGGSSSSSESSVETKTGYYIDAAVEGAEYKCTNSESNETTSTGTTDENGAFEYEQGDTCTFSIAGFNLKTINTSDLNDTNIVLEDDAIVAQLLQSLDLDGNASNGITLRDDVLKVLGDYNLSTLPTEDELSIIIDALKVIEGYEGDVVTQAEALAHLDYTQAVVAELNGTMDIAQFTSYFNGSATPANGTVSASANGSSTSATENSANANTQQDAGTTPSQPNSPVAQPAVPTPSVGAGLASTGSAENGSSSSSTESDTDATGMTPNQPNSPVAQPAIPTPSVGAGLASTGSAENGSSSSSTESDTDANTQQGTNETGMTTGQPTPSAEQPVTPTPSMGSGFGHSSAGSDQDATSEDDSSSDQDATSENDSSSNQNNTSNNSSSNGSTNTQSTQTPRF